MRAANTVVRGDRRSNVAVLPDNTSGASRSASATPSTYAAVYGGPALADHSESHPAGTNATANCEEPL